MTVQLFTWGLVSGAAVWGWIC